MVNDKIAIIGDEDTVIGLRMAGVHECSMPESPEETRDTLLAYFGDPQMGLILITEPLAQKVEDTILELSQAPIPLILLIPDRHGATGTFEEVLKEMIRRAVGFQIKI